jgi:NADPH:quinone reductase-like Zn-dependent oxidoreductase
MKIFELSNKGIESLQPAERETPIPGAEEVLLRVRAVSLNYRDLLIARDTYVGPVRYPLSRHPTARERWSK